MTELFNLLNFGKKKKEEEQELQEVIKFPIEIFCYLEFKSQAF